MPQAESRSKTKIMAQFKEPPMFRVIYLNDNQTSVEFVIDSLVDYFDYTADLAVEVTTHIHDAGSAVVAVLPFEIAEQKGIEVTMNARSLQYPLQIKLEPEASD